MGCVIRGVLSLGAALWIGFAAAPAGASVQGQGRTWGRPRRWAVGATGIHLMGSGHRLVGFTAVGSATGMHPHAMACERGGVPRERDLKLSENRARNNGGAGIAVRGLHIVDGGGNTGTGNGGVQCELAGEACAP